MNRYQKIAALVIRLTAVLCVLYSLSTVVVTLFLMPQAAMLAIPTLAIGVIVYLGAFPLAKLTTFGIED